MHTACPEVQYTVIENLDFSICIRQNKQNKLQDCKIASLDRIKIKSKSRLHVCSELLLTRWGRHTRSNLTPHIEILSAADIN